MKRKLMVVITCLVLLICFSVGTANAVVKTKSHKNKSKTESSKKQPKPNKYSLAGILSKYLRTLIKTSILTTDL